MGIRGGNGTVPQDPSPDCDRGGGVVGGLTRIRKGPRTPGCPPGIPTLGWVGLCCVGEPGLGVSSTRMRLGVRVGVGVRGSGFRWHILLVGWYLGNPGTHHD